jgi:hypothetical protein
MNPADNVELAIERLYVSTSAELDRRILADASAALEESVHKQPARARRGWYVVSVSRLIRLGAVAAVVLLAFTLFFRGPAVKAVTLAEIYEAVQRVKNVCISRFQPGEQEPLQKEWVSSTLNIRLLEDKREFVLWDLANGLSKRKRTSSDIIETSVLAEGVLAGARKAIAHSFGLVPFSDLSAAPEGARWHRVDDPEVAAVVPGTEVYDLTWPQKGTKSGMVRFIKYRFFVDISNNLPKRTEHYWKLKSEDEYKFVHFEVVTYPSEPEVSALIQNTFGARDDEVSKR